MILKLLVEGGAMKPGPAIAQKLGPLGINLGKLIQDINAATASFKGMKVPVLVDINPKTKEIKLEVQTPPLAELIKKELGVEKGTSQPRKIKIGNLAFEKVIALAKTKAEGMLVKDLRAAIKTVLGTCSSLGVLVDSKEPKEILHDLEAGVYDHAISVQLTTVSKEKAAKLAADFEVVRKAQEELLRREEEARKAKEEAAAAAAPAAPEASKKAKAVEESKEK